MCKNEINKIQEIKKLHKASRGEGSERNGKRLHQTTSTLQMESLFVSRIAIKKVVFRVILEKHEISLVEG